ALSFRQRFYKCQSRCRILLCPLRHNVSIAESVATQWKIERSFERRRRVLLRPPAQQRLVKLAFITRAGIRSNERERVLRIVPRHLADNRIQRTVPLRAG